MNIKKVIYLAVLLLLVTPITTSIISASGFSYQKEIKDNNVLDKNVSIAHRGLVVTLQNIHFLPMINLIKNLIRITLS